MALLKATDLTLRPPRITQAKFRTTLLDHDSPAYPEADAIWAAFTAGGVDPSFALGHFQVESLMGKAGWATKTRSWGNQVYDPFNMAGIDQYAATNGFVYASFDSWADGAAGYVDVVKRYAITSDPRYGSGPCDNIDQCTARWAAKPLDSPFHLNYVQIILNLVNNEIEYVPGTYVPAGDTMIDTSRAKPSSAERYSVANGTPLYRGPGGDILKLASFATSPALCRFMGPAGATAAYDDPVWSWGTVIVNVSGLGEREVYIKNPSKTRVTRPSLLSRLAPRNGPRVAPSGEPYDLP